MFWSIFVIKVMKHRPKSLKRMKKKVFVCAARQRTIIVFQVEQTHLKKYACGDLWGENNGLG